MIDYTCYGERELIEELEKRDAIIKEVKDDLRVAIRDWNLTNEGKLIMQSEIIRIANKLK